MKEILSYPRESSHDERCMIVCSLLRISSVKVIQAVELRVVRGSDKKYGGVRKVFGMLNEGGGSVDESDTRDKKCFFKTIIARVTNAEWKLVTSSLGRNYDDVNV